MQWCCLTACLGNGVFFYRALSIEHKTSMSQKTPNVIIAVWHFSVSDSEIDCNVKILSLINLRVLRYVEFIGCIVWKESDTIDRSPTSLVISRWPLRAHLRLRKARDLARSIGASRGPSCGPSPEPSRGPSLHPSGGPSLEARRVARRKTRTYLRAQ